jgi:SWI/SNF-related matrix-associated actin-dependent regulator of chromatin subfamily D
MFKDLIEMEQRLDWTMLRKRAEVNDALGRVVKVSQQQRRIRPMVRS